MPHRNARLTVHGRQLLVDRVSSGRPVAHVAKEVGVSRQCAHRWVARYAAEGEAGLQDRSSRSQRSPRRTSPAVEAAVENGKVERFNRTLQIEWALQVFLSNPDRAAALAPWLEFYNTRRRHTALGGLPPTSRLSPTL
jgi:hypothetical protein